MKIQEPIRKKEKKTNEKEVLEVQEANVQIFHFDHNHSGNHIITNDVINDVIISLTL